MTRLAGVIVGRMAGVLGLSECVDEPLHQRGKLLAILAQVASGFTVFHSAGGSQPGVLVKPTLRGANQAIAVAGGKRVEHRVVRRADRSSDGIG